MLDKLNPHQRSVQRRNLCCGYYLVFLGPAMFDQIPCEVYLTRVTPPLLGLSEVTAEASVSHNFLHSPWNTACAICFSIIFLNITNFTCLDLSFPFSSPLHREHSSC